MYSFLGTQSTLQAPGPAVDVFSIEVGGMDLHSTLCQLLSPALWHTAAPAEGRLPVHVGGPAPGMRRSAPRSAAKCRKLRLWLKVCRRESQWPCTVQAEQPTPNRSTAEPTSSWNSGSWPLTPFSCFCWEPRRSAHRTCRVRNSQAEAMAASLEGLHTRMACPDMLGPFTQTCKCGR